MRLTLWYFLLLIACQRSQRNPCPDLSPLAAWDTMGDARILHETRFSRDSTFEYKHLSQFDTAITINLHEGWGSFDYYAMLYTQSGGVQSELFQIVRDDELTLNDSFFNLPAKLYGRARYGSIRKKVCTQTDLTGLFYLLDSCNFWCTPRDANNCHSSVDGLSWKLTVKVGSKFHSVFWPECYYSNADTGCINKCREMEIIAMRIFYAAGYPKNEHIVISKDNNIGNDSIAYWVFAPLVFPKTETYCRMHPVKEGKLVVSKDDKDWFKFLEVEEHYFNDTIRYVPKHIFWDKK